MSAPRAWQPDDLVWRNRHAKVVHLVRGFSAERGETYTDCGICVPAPRTETRSLDKFPSNYTPCTTCYPLGRVL